MNEQNFFQGASGGYSMRRFLAFLFTITSIISGCFAIWKGYDWQVVAVAFGIPEMAALLLMFFTTWDDVSKVISFKKGEER